MVLNSIRSHRSRFHQEWGEVVLCCDNRNYWRRQQFPYYKSHRKKARDESNLDWETIFKCMDLVRAELKEFFPYKILDVDGAEADDVIAVLVNEPAVAEEDTGLGAFLDTPTHKCLIVSADKDFIQLHRSGVKQYDPIRKYWVTHPNPIAKLHEHIIRGDPGDGIPNIRSADDSFIQGVRQKPITARLIEECNSLTTDDLLYRNYVRNRQLIDLNYIPQTVKDRILEAYTTQETNGRGKLFDYFISRGLKHLLEAIGDF